MKNFYKQKNPGTVSYQGGFTLVETLVAISIFTMSLVALIVVLGKGISDTDYTKAKNVSAYLAQEGMEYIRNMRDTYMLYDPGGTATGWTNFNVHLTTYGCFGANGCYFDPANIFSYGANMPITQIPIYACGSSACSAGAMLYNSSTGIYGYTTGTNSGFIRKITASVVSANETKISSTVYWSQGLESYKVTFSENLFNWIE